MQRILFLSLLQITLTACSARVEIPSEILHFSRSVSVSCLWLCTVVKMNWDHTALHLSLILETASALCRDWRIYGSREFPFCQSLALLVDHRTRSFRGWNQVQRVMWAYQYKSAFNRKRRGILSVSHEKKKKKAATLTLFTSKLNRIDACGNKQIANRLHFSGWLIWHAKYFKKRKFTAICRSVTPADSYLSTYNSVYFTKF